MKIGELLPLKVNPFTLSPVSLFQKNMFAYLASLSVIMADASQKCGYVTELPTVVMQQMRRRVLTVVS